MLRNKVFLLSLTLFILLNIFLYCFMSFSHAWLGFNNDQWVYRYLDDPRMLNQPFNFLRGLGVWDAQWYLRIADGGYPIYWVIEYNGLSSYAFFPLYPIIIASLNFFVNNVELSAFFVSNILLLANFFSLYYVISKLYSSKIAIKATWLLFLFPFSIFYRSYFTEGLFLLLLTWFAYFLIKKKWSATVLFASLLFITRPNAIILSLILFWSLYKAVVNKSLSVGVAFLYVALMLIPYAEWLYFCYLNTGDLLYWQKAFSLWYPAKSTLYVVIDNIVKIFSFWGLPIHGYHSSKLDTVMVLAVICFLLVSRRHLKPQLWWISLLVGVFPLLVKDTASYSRYQSVLFPLFIYLALILNKTYFIIVSFVFFILLCMTSIIFVNWYWLG